MEGFGEFIGWLIAATLTVLLVVFLADKIGIWDICAIWDTSCSEFTRQPKDEPKPIARQSVPPERVRPKQEKQERGASLPKALLPEIKIGGIVINKTVEKQTSGDVAIDFLGHWSGNVIQTGAVKDQYPVVLTINSGRINERVGAVTYVTLKCAGDLFLIAATYIRISLEERLTKGKTQCVDRAVITLTPRNDGTLEYNVRVADLAGESVLKRQAP